MICLCWITLNFKRCYGECVQHVELVCTRSAVHTHRYRVGREGGGVAVTSRLFTLCVCGRVQGQGVLGHRAWSRVVGRRMSVGRGVLGGDPILWWRGVLGRRVGLGHGFRGGWGLLVTLRGRTEMEG